MEKAFDDIFNQKSNDDGSYYTEAAMQYLNDFEEMREKFEYCMEKYLQIKQAVKSLKELTEKYKSQNRNLKLMLEEKNQQIGGLLTRLKYYEGSKNRLTINEVEAQVNALISQIKVYIEHYKKTGTFDNINEVINDVRTLFNMTLIELNVLNSENKEVSGILNTLTSLEVIKIIF